MLTHSITTNVNAHTVYSMLFANVTNLSLLFLLIGITSFFLCVSLFTYLMLTIIPCLSKFVSIFFCIVYLATTAVLSSLPRVAEPVEAGCIALLVSRRYLLLLHINVNIFHSYC